MLSLKKGHRGLAWPSPHPADGFHPTSIAGGEDDGGDAAKMRQLRLKYIQAKPGGYPGVGGISPLLQDSDAGHRGQIMN